MAIKFVLGPLHQLVLNTVPEGDRLLCEVAFAKEAYLTEYEKRSATHYTWTGRAYQTAWQTMVGVEG